MKNLGYHYSATILLSDMIFVKGKILVGRVYLGLLGSTWVNLGQIGSTWVNLDKFVSTCVNLGQLHSICVNSGQFVST